MDTTELLRKVVYEEDIERICEYATNVMGKPGRLLERSENVLLDVVLVSDRHGKIWYGDLLTDELAKVQTIAREATCSIRLVRETEAFDLTVSP